jgi:hypothetical protein
VKPEPTAPANAAAATEETFTGPVHTTQTRKMPRIVVGEARYNLKAAENAGATVADTIARISKGELTGDYVVKGVKATVDGQATILVNSISKKQP